MTEFAIVSYKKFMYCLCYIVLDVGEHTSLLHRSSSMEMTGGSDEFSDAVSVLSDTVDYKGEKF